MGINPTSYRVAFTDELIEVKWKIAHFEAFERPKVERAERNAKITDYATRIICSFALLLIMYTPIWVPLGIGIPVVFTMLVIQGYYNRKVEESTALYKKLLEFRALLDNPEAKETMALYKDLRKNFLEFLTLHQNPKETEIIAALDVENPRIWRPKSLCGMRHQFGADVVMEKDFRKKLPKHQVIENLEFLELGELPAIGDEVDRVQALFNKVQEDYRNVKEKVNQFDVSPVDLAAIEETLGSIEVDNQEVMDRDDPDRAWLKIKETHLEDRLQRFMAEISRIEKKLTKWLNKYPQERIFSYRQQLNKLEEVTKDQQVVVRITGARRELDALEFRIENLPDVDGNRELDRFDAEFLAPTYRVANWGEASRLKIWGNMLFPTYSVEPLELSEEGTLEYFFNNEIQKIDEKIVTIHRRRRLLIDGFIMRVVALTVCVVVEFIFPYFWIASSFTALFLIAMVANRYIDDHLKEMYRNMEGLKLWKLLMDDIQKEIIESLPPEERRLLITSLLDEIRGEMRPEELWKLLKSRCPDKTDRVAKRWGLSDVIERPQQRFSRWETYFFDMQRGREELSPEVEAEVLRKEIERLNRIHEEIYKFENNDRCRLLYKGVKGVLNASGACSRHISIDLVSRQLGSLFPRATQNEIKDCIEDGEFPKKIIDFLENETSSAELDWLIAGLRQLSQSAEITQDRGQIAEDEETTRVLHFKYHRLWEAYPYIGRQMKRRIDRRTDLLKLV